MGAAWSGPRQVTLESLALESGATLAPVTIAYETWGRLAPKHDNVALLCHALTGDAHACDSARPNDPRAGWWNPLIGPGRALDTDRYFVVCSNVLGGCYGTTGPTSASPDGSQPYRLRFPHVTIGDMVGAQRTLLATLGVERLALVAGGSVGGLQALEWSIAYPEQVARAVVIGAAPRLSAQGIAIDTIARQAIMTDPAWQGGAYALGAGPTVGLGVARMLGMLTYTSPVGLDARFGRQLAAQESGWPAFGPRWDVASYLEHQADKLVARFDANTYLYLTSAMDRYDAAAGRGTDAEALAQVRAETLLIGVSSDWLYPAASVRALAGVLTAAGAARATYRELVSVEGHDAFLKDWEQMDAALRSFLSPDRQASPR
jgi:homoserine O-acetyltransferase